MKFSELSEHTLAIEYRVYIWQVSPQLGDWKNLRGTFARSKIFLAEKLTNGTLVTPTPDRHDELLTRLLLTTFRLCLKLFKSLLNLELLNNITFTWYLQLCDMKRKHNVRKGFVQNCTNL